MSKKAGGKGQKFGRKRDRSPSHKNYMASNKQMANKIRKLRKHVASHPNDQRNASALTTISKGAAGAAASFPTPVPNKSSLKTTGLHDLQYDYRKHIVRKGSDGKREIVPTEVASTNPIFEVVSSCGVVQERSLVAGEAEVFYDRSHGACGLVERVGDKVKVLKNKRATPPKGWENQFAKAYAG